MKHFFFQLAQTLTPGKDVDIPTLTADQVLQNGLNIAYFLAGSIAVITIIVAGIMYATSGGDSGSVGKAKNLILYSIVGLVVIFSAFLVTNFVIGRF
jgi:type IV secretory pathway VirB2 component (pilin)